MKRITLTPRENWQQRLEEAGCSYHTIDGKPYWNEIAAYVLTAKEVDALEDATNELHAMCMDLARDAVEAGDYEGYGFPDEVKFLVERSWRAADMHVSGRFDLLMDHAGVIKMLEYNADTPTALPEAAVWQWHALEDRSWPDQFNSIHEALTEHWSEVIATLPADNRRIHLTAMAEAGHEDWGNVHYIVDLLNELGVDAASINIEDIGHSEKIFATASLHNGPREVRAVDALDREIAVLWKLYPWEWMMMDGNAWDVRFMSTRFIEPAWKMLLSTKAILPRLWKRHPKHPLLLESTFDDGRGRLQGTDWVRKPILGREGANVSIAGSDPAVIEPRYDKYGYVYQRYFESAAFGDRVPVVGSWVVGNRACGIGIREDTSRVTTNASQFVPHYFED